MALPRRARVPPPLAWGALAAPDGGQSQKPLLGEAWAAVAALLESVAGGGAGLPPEQGSGPGAGASASAPRNGISGPAPRGPPTLSHPALWSPRSFASQPGRGRGYPHSYLQTRNPRAPWGWQSLPPTPRAHSGPALASCPRAQSEQPQSPAVPSAGASPSSEAGLGHQLSRQWPPLSFVGAQGHLLLASGDTWAWTAALTCPVLFSCGSREMCDPRQVQAEILAGRPLGGQGSQGGAGAGRLEAGGRGPLHWGPAESWWGGGGTFTQRLSSAPAGLVLCHPAPATGALPRGGGQSGVPERVQSCGFIEQVVCRRCRVWKPLFVLPSSPLSGRPRPVGRLQGPCSP